MVGKQYLRFYMNRIGVRGFRWRRSYFLLFLWVCFSVILLTLINIVNKINNVDVIRDHLEWNLDRDEPFSIDVYAVETEGCIIPGFGQYDDEIERIMKLPLRLRKCPHIPNLIGKNKTHVWVNTQNLHFYYNSTNSKIKNNVMCQYKPFMIRPKSFKDAQNTTNLHKRSVLYLKTRLFSSSVEVNRIHEYVKIICTIGPTEIYRNLYLFAQKKRIKYKGVNGTKASHNNSNYNVLIIGLDGISRVHIHKALPKTIKYIQELGAVDMAGYNTISDYMFTNLAPILSGLKMSEFQIACFEFFQNSTNCKLIFDRFKKVGYHTAFVEDSDDSGFEYFMKSLGVRPSYYYYSHRLLGTGTCLQGKYAHQILLDYIADLTTSLEKNRLFGHFWESSISHDNFQDVKVMDNDYLKLFQKLNNSKYLEETIVFFLSDHGMLFNNISKTQRESLELLLPFLFVLVPPSFRESYGLAYKYLQQNGRRLTTPLDVHKTLLDTVNLSNIDDKNVAKNVENMHEDSEGATRRAQSLFLPISDQRTCIDADIELHLCTCHLEQPLALSSKLVTKGLRYFIMYLNDLVKGFQSCVYLLAKQVVEAAALRPTTWPIRIGRTVATPKKDKEWLLRLIVETEPGGGKFQALLRKQKGRPWALASSVRRLNPLTNKQNCVSNERIRPFCQCQ